ncbi:MAG TPA: sulfite exporter TauE/SafE family protein [Acidimicrobiales bacterium]|nr:sulfite exporter TauE/SafE family protein [Acidimicrobiales bacterium]
MHISDLDLALAGLASVGAGIINSLAGGGTLISFPALVALGVPAVQSNVTNTVSLLPGYLAGSYAQRDDLRPQLAHARLLAAVSAVGGLVGSILLVVLPGSAFRAAVPYLILLSCGLLAFGDRLRRFSSAHEAGLERRGRGAREVLFLGTVFLGAAYGGFFGAGLGIMLLALLALFSAEPLTKLNALKQALSFVINLVAAVFFLFSGKVVWTLVPVMAVGSLLGGFLGGRLVQVINADLLRRVVVVAGVAVAISFWVG